ncbi:hypothetical protein LWI29_001626 [Acer saccharum]|uniref:Nudix hydrolase domain-containing protein n=1 Tax=Acer saccharum TaxID=4024 RepID=A0AA39T9Z3_ACESA|nr:hypothetical protein LWI29_001626 [Acer saccharum]
MLQPENEVEYIELLSSIEDAYGGVTVEMKEPMDSKLFASMLGSSLSYWKQQKKRGVWIKLPIQFSNLVEPTVKEGFRYHHAESDYLMLVKWIPETSDTLPANASHRVAIGAFVMNDKGEVLVVQERNGRFKGTNVWKLPTGTVDEGEDICTAAIREVKEETGVDTEFVEVLAFRYSILSLVASSQSHHSFFRKSNLFFVCMLRPRSFEIQKQDYEIEAAQVNNDDKHVEEVQVDSSAIGKVSSGSEKTSLKASNILSSLEIVAFTPSELKVVEIGSSNSNIVKTMDATKTFNMNDDASTRQHTGPIILHNSTPILNSNTGPMESDLQDRHLFKDNTSVDVGTSNSNSLNNFSGKDDKVKSYSWDWQRNDPGIPSSNSYFCFR